MRRLYRYVSLGVLGAGGVAAPVIFLSAAPAAAAPTCSATIGGQDANQFTTPDKAYTVREHTSVAVAGQNVYLLGGTPLHYLIQMQFYLPFGDKVGWTVAQGDSSSNVFRRTVEVDKYAKYSTGLYLVHVVSFGPAGEGVCAVDGFVNVVPSGLSDVEIGGFAIGGLGLVGATLAGVTAAQEGRKLSDPDKLAEDAAADAQEDFWETMEDLHSCGFLVIPALLLLGRAVLSNAFHAAVHHLTRST